MAWSFPLTISGIDSLFIMWRVQLNNLEMGSVNCIQRQKFNIPSWNITFILIYSDSYSKEIYKRWREVREQERSSFFADIL